MVIIIITYSRICCDWPCLLVSVRYVLTCVWAEYLKRFEIDARSNGPPIGNGIQQMVA